MSVCISFFRSFQTQKYYSNIKIVFKKCHRSLKSQFLVSYFSKSYGQSSYTLIIYSFHPFCISGTMPMVPTSKDTFPRPAHALQFLTSEIFTAAREQKIQSLRFWNVAKSLTLFPRFIKKKVPIILTEIHSLLERFSAYPQTLSRNSSLARELPSTTDHRV